MNKKLIWIIGSLIGVIIILLMLQKTSLFGRSNEIKVTSEKVVPKNITEIVSANGKVFPEIEVKISSDISGEVTQLNVQEGDSIRKGQVLARIYADIYNTQREQAAAEVNKIQAGVDNSRATLEAFKARLDQAKTNYDRQKTLLDDRVISKVEFEQADNTYKTALSDYNAAQQTIRSGQAGVSSATAMLSRANKDLSRATIISPMTGIVSSLSVKKGEKVVGTAQMAGTEIMRIADMNLMEVRVEVGENDITKVHLGDSARVSIDAYNNRKFLGVVTKIASSNTAANNNNITTSSTSEVTNYLVNIRLLPSSYQDLISNSSKHIFPFRPGMNASVDIYTTTHNNVLSVPLNAVTTLDKTDQTSQINTQKKENEKESHIDEMHEVVFVLQKDQTVKSVIIKTSIQDMNSIEITNGLKEGDEVITGPYNVINKKLKDGIKVKVVAKDKLFEEEDK